MPVELPEQRARFRIPEADGEVVLGNGGQKPAAGAEGEAFHRQIVALETMFNGAGPAIPDENLVAIGVDDGIACGEGDRATRQVAAAHGREQRGSGLVIGVAAGMPFAGVLEAVTTGVGSTLAAIAVLVGLGAMFGQMLEVSGGIEALAAS